MAKTLPDDVVEGVGAIVRIFDAMVRAAKHQAKKNPTASGLYPVTVLMDSGGMISCDDAGTPIVVVPPISVAGLSEDDRAVAFFHTEQRLSPKQAADLAGVHKATIHRAVNAGELPKPTQVSTRRVVHRLSDIHEWLVKRGSEQA